MTFLSMYNPPGDLPPLYELKVPSPMDLIVWGPISQTSVNPNWKMTVENDVEDHLLPGTSLSLIVFDFIVTVP